MPPKPVPGGFTWNRLPATICAVLTGSVALGLVLVLSTRLYSVSGALAGAGTAAMVAAVLLAVVVRRAPRACGTAGAVFAALAAPGVLHQWPTSSAFYEAAQYLLVMAGACLGHGAASLVLARARSRAALSGEFPEVLASPWQPVRLVLGALTGVGIFMGEYAVAQLVAAIGANPHADVAALAACRVLAALTAMSFGAVIVFAALISPTATVLAGAILIWMTATDPSLDTPFDVRPLAATCLTALVAVSLAVSLHLPAALSPRQRQG